MISAAKTTVFLASLALAGYGGFAVHTVFAPHPAPVPVVETPAVAPAPASVPDLAPASVTPTSEEPTPSTTPTPVPTHKGHTVHKPLLCPSTTP